MNKTVLKRFLGYLKPYRFVVIMVLIVSFISVVLDVQLPKILGNATTLISNSFIESNYTSVDIAGVFEIGKLLAILYVLAAGLNFLGKYFMSRVSSDIIYRLQKEIDEKFTRLPVRYFDEQSRGDLLSRATNDIQTIDDSFSQVSVQFFTTVLTFIGIIIMMFTISIPLAIVGILGIPLSMFAIGMIGKKSAASFASRQETTGTINGYIEEYYAGHDIVNAFNYEDRSEKAFSKLNDELYEHSWKATFFAGLMQPISRLINNVVYVFVAIIGGFLATGGMITIGGIQAILQYMQNISQPMGEAANMMGLTQSMLAAAERIFELLDAEEMEEETGKPAFPEVRGDVTFKHVSFGYTPEVQLMKDLNIDVKAGETVAIVGPTGAGKTTVINLLMRFYDITGGAIEIDGHNIQDYTKESLRSKVGMVLQDTWLFKGTIRENIIKARLIEGIVALPSQLFYTTGIPVSLWFLNREKKQKDKILFVDARNMGTMVTRKLRELQEADIKKIADTFDKYNDGTLENEKGFCAVATLDDVAKQDYILTPGRYVGIAEQEDDGIPFQEKMDKLTTELSDLFAQSHDLEDEIRKQLASIGFTIK